MRLLLCKIYDEKNKTAKDLTDFSNRPDENLAIFSKRIEFLFDQVKNKYSDIFEMGNSAPKYSFIVKLLMKFFLSPLRSFKEGPNYWKKHYDFGILDTHELNEKEKYLVIRLKEYKFHPIICIYFQGYFQRIAQYVIKSEKFTTEETKCMHRGDLYHEFVVHWQ